MRKKKGFTQKMLAAKLKMSRSNLGNAEKGKQSFMPFHIYRISKILNCHITELYPFQTVHNRLK